MTGAGDPLVRAAELGGVLSLDCDAVIDSLEERRLYAAIWRGELAATAN
jgi:hypothetical protein